VAVWSRDVYTNRRRNVGGLGCKKKCRVLGVSRACLDLLAPLQNQTRDEQSLLRRSSSCATSHVGLWFGRLGPESPLDFGGFS
jgi:hypothetical protein